MVNKIFLLGLFFLAPACGESAGGPPDGGTVPDGAEPAVDGDVPDAGGGDACVSTTAWISYRVEGDQSKNDLYLTRLAGLSAAEPQRITPPADTGAMFARGPTDARFAPDARRFAYRDDQDVRDRRELYVAAIAETTVATPVKVNGYVPDNVQVWNYLWSPDSNEIAYLSDRLWVVNLAGATPSMPRQVSPEPVQIGEEVLEPAWAPGGGYLAYNYEAGGETQAYVVDSAGEHLRTVSISEGGPWFAGWRPGRSQMLIHVGHPSTLGNSLYLVDVTGGVPGELAPIEGLPTAVSMEVWSPDTGSLAILGSDPGEIGYDWVRSLWVVDMSAPPYVARRLPGDQDLRILTLLAWASDGRTLVFDAAVGAEGYRHLFAVRTDLDDDPVQLSRFPDPDPSCGYVWDAGVAPAGGLAWFRATDECLGGINLYTVDLRAWPPSPGVRVSPALFFDRAVHPEIAWAPDGSALVYLADVEADADEEAWVVAFDDGTPRASVKLHPELSPFDPGLGDVLMVSFAADSRRVLYEADQDINNLLELYVVELAGGIPGDPHKVNGPLFAGDRVLEGFWQPNAGGCAP